MEEEDRASIDTPVVSPKDGATMNESEDQEEEALNGIAHVSSNEASKEGNSTTAGGGDEEEEEEEEGAVKVKEEKEADDDEEGEGSTKIKQEKLDQLLSEYEKEAGNIDAAIKKEMQKNQGKNASKTARKKTGGSSSSTNAATAAPSGPPKCLVCSKEGKCKYNIVRNGGVQYLCDDACFKKFKQSPSSFLKSGGSAAAPRQQSTRSDSSSAPSKPTRSASSTSTGNDATSSTSSSATASTSTTTASTGGSGGVRRKCYDCRKPIQANDKHFLSWECVEFCNETCLARFQSRLTKECGQCHNAVPASITAKHTVRCQNDFFIFCAGPCQDAFRKILKRCSFCFKDLRSATGDTISAGGKDFCARSCQADYDKKMKIRGDQGDMSPCGVCKKILNVKYRIQLNNKENRLCSPACFAAFRFASKIQNTSCDHCGYACGDNLNPQVVVQFEGKTMRFCCNLCTFDYRKSHKRDVPCTWCKALKSNVEMIERLDAESSSSSGCQYFCSLNCISLFRVNLNATSNKAVTCDQCKKVAPAQYHLTMSDASVRNFCSYNCVIQFQFQFTANPMQPADRTKDKERLTARQRDMIKKSGGDLPEKRQRGRPPTASRETRESNREGRMPVISGVMSLAPKGRTRSGEGKEDASTSTPAIQIPVSSPSNVKNKATLCKPYVQTKATSCRPHCQTKETQVGEGELVTKQAVFPVPVPLFVPSPVAMWATPTPYPIFMPIPIPVPIFIPTTKKSANSILKHIKEIQEKVPADPFEAELLMMAEMVAKAEGNADSSSDESDVEDTTGVPNQHHISAVMHNQQQLGNTGDMSGEDMLQMALRMAEMSESGGAAGAAAETQPHLDLEDISHGGDMSTMLAAQQQAAHAELLAQQQMAMVNKKAKQDKRRNGDARGTAGKKRPKLDERGNIAADPPAVPSEPLDANMVLKYTYGVNAWRHWVVQKNAEIEATAKAANFDKKRIRLFKTDVLQCSAMDLNTSLCLFCKEVRKPNGEEYAADSIYYLCLGVQQYLYENGRVDNIFTDHYYDKFTTILNELLRNYSPRLNSQGLLVCRIEEEILWESKQLGAHSPHVLLNTLVYFNTKYFMLRSPEEHAALSFSHVMKHWKKTGPHAAAGGVNHKGQPTGRNVYLRYYPPVAQKDMGKKKRDDLPVFEQAENVDNPLRCPVKLYEFYLSKCPESIKNRTDVFYLVPERSCVPDSPVWYSTASLQSPQLEIMLNRLRMVREVTESQLQYQASLGMYG